jgi:hypothetical protein
LSNVTAALKQLNSRNNQKKKIAEMPLNEINEKINSQKENKMK